jgi:hypothetical protein
MRETTVVIAALAGGLSLASAEARGHGARLEGGAVGTNLKCAFVSNTNFDPLSAACQS